MTLNTGGTFLEFVSNVMIVDDAIRAHKETKRGRLWLLHLVVLLRSTRQCTTTAPPTHLDSSNNTSISIHSSSGLPTHLSASPSGQHLRLYFLLRL
jgi:hypothetical protein